jgi:cysteinyl-tRNA synthetase
MAMRYLGAQFDIHTGGIDNVFPHHEDEIAQSTPIGGAVPARHWVYGEFLLSEGHKMAKSAGNFERITEIIERGIDPLALRYLMLTLKYGRKLEYTERSLAAAASALESLRSRLRALGAPSSTGPWAAPEALEAGTAGDRPDGVAFGAAGHGANGAFAVTDRAGSPVAPLSAEGRAYHDRFVAAIDDDLDTPGALALVREILRSNLPAEEKRWLVLDADMALGLDLHRVWDEPGGAASTGTAAGQSSGDPIPSNIQALIEQRTDARSAGDYGRADAIRDELLTLGWEIVDQPGGPTVRRRATAT